MNKHALRNCLQTLIAISIIVASSQLLLAQKKSMHTTAEAKEPYFDADGRKVLPVGELAADKISANSIGNVATILFNDAKVSLQKAGDPLIATWAGTLVIPTRPTPDNRPTSYMQQVRGFVGKKKDSSVTILLTLNGKTSVVTYGYGVATTGNILRQVISPIQPQPNFYVASIVIVVERRDTKSAVEVHIDSLDVNAKLKTQ